MHKGQGRTKEQHVNVLLRLRDATACLHEARHIAKPHKPRLLSILALPARKVGPDARSVPPDEQVAWRHNPLPQMPPVVDSRTVLPDRVALVHSEEVVRDPGLPMLAHLSPRYHVLEVVHDCSGGHNRCQRWRRAHDSHLAALLACGSVNVLAWSGSSRGAKLTVPSGVCM